jgi:hypothetical protein
MQSAGIVSKHASAGRGMAISLLMQPGITSWICNLTRFSYFVNWLIRYMYSIIAIKVLPV